MTPSFPHVIDNSMRAEFVSCPHAFFRRYVEGWSRTGRSIHLHFGGAFAEGLAAYRLAFYGDGRSLDDSLAAGMAAIVAAWGDYEPRDDETKTLERCVGALESTVAQYPPITDHVQPLLSAGRPAVEFDFALPLPISHPESGEPLLYSGRFDMLAKLGDSIYVEDDKTTSQLGPQWAKNWRLRSQFTGYVWGARAYGYEAQGAIIRGISILKRGFGHAEVIESREQWMIDLWYAQLLRDIRRMIASWREGYWDYNLADACSSYGGCQFLDICRSPAPERWLEGGDFEQKVYDPLGKFGQPSAA